MQSLQIALSPPDLSATCQRYPPFPRELIKPVPHSRAATEMASIQLGTLLVLACVCVVVLGAPKKDSYGGSVKKATSTTTKPPKPKCDEKCPEDYTPVCGKEKDSTEKPKSFGNICVMNKFNCEHGTNLIKESDGECKDGSGVRLA
ncbi:uncharacterized protein LOC128983031 [Macrosteles quadrilineatus]|uniref:uncharacterized protein LOC128983031 n=1 Tax=Macrosteles quadrilineatus TaxID=74068 RepID=UPI0023E23590|nr:uncharacterized protein LOC128983031 [Macrosteles quadrilineatus]